MCAEMCGKTKKLYKSIVQQVLSEFRLFPRNPGLEEKCLSDLSARLQMFFMNLKKETLSNRKSFFWKKKSLKIMSFEDVNELWKWAEVKTRRLRYVLHLIKTFKWRISEEQTLILPFFSSFLCLSVLWSSTWGLLEGAWQDSRCFLGQFFLHGRPSRPPTYLVATLGIWCFEKPRSSADSDRQGLCVLSVWKRQTGPGICFQLLSLRRRRLARGDVALHTDTASSRRK